MFRRSKDLELGGLILVLLLLVAVMGYVVRLGVTHGCYWRRRNTQIHGATCSPVGRIGEEIEGLQENAFAEQLAHAPEPGRVNRQLLLLGDSILNNEFYVTAGQRVVDWVRRKCADSGDQVRLLAKDGATIGEVWQQVNRVSIDENAPSTVLVVSVGGNDFLSGGSVESAEVTYRALVERIRQVFSLSKLYLVNLYQPVDPLFAVYGRIVTRWNAFLKGLVEEEGLADGVVDLYSVITQGDDLTHKIEPSETGGAKIAEAIVGVVGN